MEKMVFPPAPDAPDRTMDEAVDEILELRKGCRLGEGLTVRGLIDAGRR